MDRCEPAADVRQRERNPFPVFPGEPEVRGPIKRSRMGKRRALVLAGLHVAIILHIVQWRLAGSTVSPVEPSESMRTLELGEINAGFVFLLAAILTTAVFGRFVCGWGCHVVALQDLCGWIMKKLGVRPRPFRSRLLVWAPVVAGFYMFVWPTLKRVLIGPLAERIGLAAITEQLGLSIFRAPPPFPGFTNQLTTEHFWETFPGLAVAVPFLLICGFLAVYLLGAKGFCTYGCPYGGVFGPVEGIAPGRIRVDENCDGCGHCTAVCTSNVRVHEDVREFGMVVDPGCMKTLDCVDTCPRNALSFGFGRPAASKGSPRTGRFDRRYDLSWPGEIVLAVLFALAFVAWRGVYDLIPFLMAIGVAACVTYLAWLGTRLLRAESVYLQSRTLKRDGRLRGEGFLAGVVVGLVALLTLQSGVVQVARWRGEVWDRRVPVGRAEAFTRERPELDPEVRTAADRAHRWYRRTDTVAWGGLGVAAVPEVIARRAWTALVLGRHDEAAAHLERLVGREGDREARLDLARVRRAGGGYDKAADELRGLVAEDPADVDAHRELAATLVAAGDSSGAAAELVIVVNLVPEDRIARAHLVSLLERLGRADEAARYR